MAYRNVDSRITRYVAPRFVGHRWRELFFENWGLRLLALLITVGLWCGVTAQRAPVSMRLRGVQLIYRPRGDVVVSNEPQSEATITIKGSRETLNPLDARDLVATVDINDKTGVRIVELTPENIRLELPDSTPLRNVQIEKIEPESVVLQLEPRVEREVEVQAKFEGRLPEGYQLRQVRVVPDKIKISGPENAVKAVDRVTTEPIRLDEHTTNFGLQSAALELPGEKIRITNRFVAVSVEIAPSNAAKNNTP